MMKSSKLSSFPINSMEWVVNILIIPLRIVLLVKSVRKESGLKS